MVHPMFLSITLFKAFVIKFILLGRNSGQRRDHYFSTQGFIWICTKERVMNVGNLMGPRKYHISNNRFIF